MTYLGAFSAQAMVGIIWFVQIVHYPLFAQVGAEPWFGYHADHERRTGWIVAPLMILELGSAMAIVIDGGHGGLAVAGLALAGTTRILTFALAVPLHRRLNLAYDDVVVRRLVGINWTRTVVWSAHGIIALALL